MKISFYEGWDDAEKGKESVAEAAPKAPARRRGRPRRSEVIKRTFQPMPANKERLGGISHTQQIAFGMCDAYGVSRDCVVKLGENYWEIWVDKDAA